MFRPLLTTALTLGLASACLAMEPPAANHATHATTAQSPDSHSRPVLAKGASFAGSMVLAIGALFIAAAAIGIVARPQAPESLPTTHDESHSFSHHAPHH